MIPLKHVLVLFLVCFSVATYAQFKLYEKGHDRYKAGKYDESVKLLTEYLTKAHRDKKIDIDVFYIRALAQYRQEHWKEAIPDFEETLLRGHDNKGNIYWFMAKCYDGLKDDAEAVNAYDNALRELKSNRESRTKLLYERSLIHHRMGNKLLAYNDLKEASEVDPANLDAKRQLEKVEAELPVAQRQTSNDKSAATASTDSKKDAASQGSKNASKKNTDIAKSDKAKSTPAKTNTTADSKATAPATASTPEPKKEPEVTAPPANPTLADLYKDERRFALVIGNSTYPKSIGNLKNPKNDATDIAQELRDSHFEVTLLTDATYGQIRAALMKFKEKLDAGNKDQTVGLFYYAGHGLQFEDENYLVPVDAAVEYEDDIPRYCFPINRMVLSNMERSNTRMNILILDACRNNPFPTVNRSLGGSGLGEMKRGRGSFIAYATAPGSVASDGTGRNGLYTQELLKAMKKPGLTIEQVFKEVRVNVLRQSNNKQNTWDSSNIIGEFHFKY